MKLHPVGNKGIPDRLVLLPHAPALFVETKRPVGGRLSKAQHAWHDWLRGNDFRVFVINTKALVDGLVDAYQRSRVNDTYEG